MEITLITLRSSFKSTCPVPCSNLTIQSNCKVKVSLPWKHLGTCWCDLPKSLKCGQKNL